MSTTSVDPKAIQRRIIAKAWSDASYKQRLLNNPSEIFHEEGYTVSEPITVSEEVDGALNFILPPAPPNSGSMSAPDRETAVGTKLRGSKEMF